MDSRSIIPMLSMMMVQDTFQVCMCEHYLKIPSYSSRRLIQLKSGLELVWFNVATVRGAQEFICTNPPAASVLGDFN